MLNIRYIRYLLENRMNLSLLSICNFPYFQIITVLQNMPLCIAVAFVCCIRKTSLNRPYHEKISFSKKQKGNSRNEDRKIKILESVF